MLIFERSITREEADFVLRYLDKRIHSNWIRSVGTTGVYEIFGNENTTSYAVLDGADPVGWLKLQRKPGWEAYEVKHVWVEPAYRGTGITERIYRVAINHDNRMIASGITQTKWARALWTKFVRDDTFNIWVQNLNVIEERAPVVYDENELYTSIPDLYTKDVRLYKHRDIRLIAIRK